MAIDMDGGTVTKKISKATPGTFFTARVTNANAAVRFFQIHDKATAPAGTDVPVLSFPIPVPSSGGLMQVGAEFLGGSFACVNGVSWAISTTHATFTDSATAAEHAVIVRYG